MLNVVSNVKSGFTISSTTPPQTLDPTTSQILIRTTTSTGTLILTLPLTSISTPARNLISPQTLTPVPTRIIILTPPGTLTPTQTETLPSTPPQTLTRTTIAPRTARRTFTPITTLTPITTPITTLPENSTTIPPGSLTPTQTLPSTPPPNLNPDLNRDPDPDDRTWAISHHYWTVSRVLLLLLDLLCSYSLWVARRRQRSVVLHQQRPSEIELLLLGRLGSSENIVTLSHTTL